MSETKMRDASLESGGSPASDDATAPSAMPGFRGGWIALIMTIAARTILVVVGLLVLISVIPAAFGWHPTVVSSGSMQPKLLVGDVVISRPISQSAPLQLGQVILETDPDHTGRLRLHRLVSIDGNGNVVTKGDANHQADSSTVPMSGVLGIGVLRVAHLGMPGVWIQAHETGNLAILAAVLALLAAAAFLFREDKADVDGSDDPPATAKWRNTGHRSHRAQARPRAGSRSIRKIAIAGITALVIGLVPAAPASAAFGATTSNAANTLASTARFACSDRVVAEGPTNYYKLGESSGTVAADSSGNGHPGTYSTGITYGVAGPCSIDGATAVTLNGGSTTGITTANAVTRPDLFTAEIWFKTTTATGGLLLGMFDTPTGSNGQRDPVVYMQNSGQIDFGMWDGSAFRVVASPSAYNNGAWHLLDATYSATAGLALFIDGSSVGTLAVTAANSYTGYWRIGYAGLNVSPPWPNAPSSTGFTGSVASAAIYSQVLTNSLIAQNYAAVNSRSNCASTVLADSPTNFYKLGEAAVGAAADSSGNNFAGAYRAAGITYGVAGPCSLDANTGVTLAGGAAIGITTSNPVTRPSVFSAEIWFKTTTVGGGYLLGMLDTVSGSNGNRDPVIYMSNSGQVNFGLWDGTATHTVTSPLAYNNGGWHLLDATYNASAGLTLYVDGSSVATLSDTAAQIYTGYWRIGYASITTWPGSPTNGGFAGSIANAAIYSQTLSAQQVAAHYAAR